jgi:N-dimethylarginine dimethylaminohydrolase
MKFGGQSETGKIRSILLKHPKDAFIDQENINDQWKQINYDSPPNFIEAAVEYEKFIELLKTTAEEIYFLPQDKRTTLDSIYVHDPVLITDKGAILCSMGKDTRRGEPSAVGSFLNDIGVPVIGEIKGDGRLEGGDIVWLDKKILAVGEGYRTNREGINQLKRLVSDVIEEFIVVPLPHWNGRDDVLHLMSMISPIDRDLAVVYSKQMPVRFRQYLFKRGMKLIEVSDSEYESMGCNILALKPRKCLMLSGNPETMEKLVREGVEVLIYDGFEISRKGFGGPTCLTRPLLRNEV